MATPKRPEPQDEAPRQIILLNEKEPVAPKDMTEAEIEDLKVRTAEVVEQLQNASGSRELAVVDSIAAMGIQAQRQAAGELELLRVRMKDIMDKDGPSARIPQDLIDLRFTLNQIDPHQASSQSIVRRVIDLLPFGKDRMLRVLERIAVRYEPVSKQVVLIETRLREGRAMLVRDNIEMRKLYEQVEAQQTVVQKNAYLGELVMQELSQALEDTEDTHKRERMQSALFDVASRTQDLRQMEEVHIQFFVSLDMTRENNIRLGQAVERTLTLATNVVMVGLAIQSALERQRRVMEATQRTREFIGNLLIANAASIKRHTMEIGDIYNSPVVAMDKVTKAHQDLLEAIDMADRLKTEGLETARQNIATLARLSAQLEERRQGLREQLETPSLEA